MSSSQVNPSVSVEDLRSVNEAYNIAIEVYTSARTPEERAAILRVIEALQDHLWETEYQHQPVDPGYLHQDQARVPSASVVNIEPTYHRPSSANRRLQASPDDSNHSTFTVDVTAAHKAHALLIAAHAKLRVRELSAIDSAFQAASALTAARVSLQIHEAKVAVAHSFRATFFNLFKGPKLRLTFMLHQATFNKRVNHVKALTSQRVQASKKVLESSANLVNRGIELLNEERMGLGLVNEEVEYKSTKMEDSDLPWSEQGANFQVDLEGLYMVTRFGTN